MRTATGDLDSKEYLDKQSGNASTYVTLSVKGPDLDTLSSASKEVVAQSWSYNQAVASNRCIFINLAIT